MSTYKVALVSYSASFPGLLQDRPLRRQVQMIHQEAFLPVVTSQGVVDVPSGLKQDWLF